MQSADGHHERPVAPLRRPVNQPNHPIVTASVAHQKDLEALVAAAVEGTRSGLWNAEKLAVELAATQRHVAGLGQFVSCCLPPLVYNERRRADSTVALDVFENVPELFEMIVEYLEIPDILNLSVVNKSLRGVINGSSKIQIQLCLRAAWSDSHLKLPLASTLCRNNHDEGCCINHCTRKPVGFTCTAIIASDTRDMERRLLLARFHLLPGQRLPRFGAKVREMVVCQPPVKEMRAHRVCCPPPGWTTGHYDEAGHTMVRNDGGITIGDLYKAAQVIIDKHRYCPLTDSRNYDADGTVNAGLYFTTNVHLWRDDPMVLRAMKHEQECVERETRSRAHAAKMSLLARARTVAHSYGNRVPTLQEFETAYPPDADWQSILFHQTNANAPYPAHPVALPPFNPPGHAIPRPPPPPQQQAFYYAQPFTGPIMPNFTPITLPPMHGYLTFPPPAPVAASTTAEAGDSDDAAGFESEIE